MGGDEQENGHVLGTPTEYVQPRPRRPVGRSPLVKAESAQELEVPRDGYTGRSGSSR